MNLINAGNWLNLFDTGIVIFAAGYVLCLLTPGPNLLVVGGVALARGVRATLPLNFGIAIGSIALSGCIHEVVAMTPDAPLWNASGRVAGAGLLFFIALRLLRGCSIAPSRMARPAEFLLGFVTAITNPVTGAFFASQFLGGNSAESEFELGFILLIVGAFAFVRNLLVAYIFGAPRWRDRAMSYARPVSIAIGAGFAGLGIYMLSGAVEPLAQALRIALSQQLFNA